MIKHILQAFHVRCLLLILEAIQLITLKIICQGVLL